MDNIRIASENSRKEKQWTNLERSYLEEIENLEASAEINIELLEEKYQVVLQEGSRIRKAFQYQTCSQDF